ncbi:uncharacterized protein LOC111332411 isoform X1 [Stylophora pistillata]|uniref:uncharacterized protein LOC111332411 isoform X1 n=1 Tax=Stylophora pistillata TaxID=50429 RepID=UPI000C04F2A0|nr:uncharacterized protein LOC111332411 isoform X1 [Stylophora pistillata]
MSFTAWISLSLFFAITGTIPASMAKSIPTSEITVTLKLDWNVTDVPKPIPASYTTKVPNGTFLIDIMNKAADNEKEGPFDKYKSTYYSVMGYFITSINGTENNPDKSSYWMIYDEQTGASLRCGVSSYLPSNDSTTLFRFTKLPSDSSHGNNASTSGRCKKHSNLPTPSSAITITIGMDWNPEVIKKPVPPPYSTKVASGTTLREIINKAADKNPKGPFNKYTSTYYGGQGHFITSMNGAKEDSTKDWQWKIYDKATEKLSAPFVDQFKPQDGSATILKFITSKESEQEFNSSGEFVGMGLVFLCISAIVEGLLFL